MSPASASLPRVAIVGASSLRGKELKLLLEERNFPAELVLLDEPEMAGTLTEAGGEPTFIRALEEDSFEGSRFAFFAGSATDADRNISVAVSSGATVIDLTGSASRTGRATTWIPAFAAALAPLPNPSANGGRASQIYSSPQTPAIIAASLAVGLAKFSPRRVVVTLFPPVSELGQPGVDELESQSASLLSFRDIAKPIFDAQVAFNLLAAYGESSPARFEDLRDSVVRETLQILAGRAPVPAIQLVQAPVFYGYAFSAFADFDAPVLGADIRSALAAVGVKSTAPSDPAPSNVSVAGEAEIYLGVVAPDPSISNSAWLWGAADNLRLSVSNAVRIAEELNAN
ncbi:MAG: Asd/ArgC dimerization domain-containing protein [Candidatus Acidiferrales bacterium]